MDKHVLKVSAKTEVKALAGAIAGAFEEQGIVEIQSIGAGALNVSTKAIIIARGFLASHGIDVICIPGFLDVDVNGEKRTAILLRLERR